MFASGVTQTQFCSWF